MLRRLGGAAGWQAAPAGALQTCMVASALILCPACCTTSLHRRCPRCRCLWGASSWMVLSGHGAWGGRAALQLHAALQRPCGGPLLIEQRSSGPPGSPKPLATSPRAPRPRSPLALPSDRAAQAPVA